MKGTTLFCFNASLQFTATISLKKKNMIFFFFLSNKVTHSRSGTARLARLITVPLLETWPRIGSRHAKMVFKKKQTGQNVVIKVAARWG